MKADAARANGQHCVRGAVSLGEIASKELRQTFPAWRIFSDAGVWWALRVGVEKPSGPESLLRRVLCAPDLSQLAERLCLQDHLDRLDQDELDAVWRYMDVPEAAG